MIIYNSVLLDKNGVIRHVKTTFQSDRTFFNAAASKNNGAYITMYSFSRYATGMFIKALSPHRFEEDDREPDDEPHLKLHEVVLEGSNLVNRSRATDHNSYAELVFCFTGQAIAYEEEIINILQIFFQYNKDHRAGQDWKIFSSRKIASGDSLFIAFSLQK